MKDCSDLTFWQNSYRRKILKEYNVKVERYFQLIDYDYDRNILDTPESERIREFINRQNEIIQDYLVGVRLSPYVFHIDPPVLGSSRRRLNLIDNLFNLQNYDIQPQVVIDHINQALGVYERDFINSMLRTINPFFWLGKILELIASIPFYLLGRIGFNQQELEGSLTGRLVKWVIKLITMTAVGWELLARLKIIPQEFDLLSLLKG